VYFHRENLDNENITEVENDETHDEDFRNAEEDFHNDDNPDNENNDENITDVSSFSSSVIFSLLFSLSKSSCVFLKSSSLFSSFSSLVILSSLFSLSGLSR
jgi:hypothetical protein